MNVAEYDREVMSYLRRYPIDDLSGPEPGGKHRKVRFTWNRKPCTMTMAISPSDTNAAKVKIGDIRRLLGPPPEEPPREPRMLPAAAPTPLSNGALAEDEEWLPCRVALRSSNGCVEFVLPEQFRDAGRYHAEFRPPREWVILPGPAPGSNRGGATFDKRGWLSCSGADALRVLGPLRMSPAECCRELEGGCLRVRLPQETPALQTRDPVRTSGPKIPDAEGAAVDEVAPPRPEPPPMSAATIPEAAPERRPAGASDMRAVLELIAEVERETPYRLKRLRTDVHPDGIWVFRAPDIALD